MQLIDEIDNFELDKEIENKKKPFSLKKKSAKLEINSKTSQMPKRKDHSSYSITASIQEKKKHCVENEESNYEDDDNDYQANEIDSESEVDSEYASFSLDSETEINKENKDERTSSKIRLSDNKGKDKKY